MKLLKKLLLTLPLLISSQAFYSAFAVNKDEDFAEYQIKDEIENKKFKRDFKKLQKEFDGLIAKRNEMQHTLDQYNKEGAKIDQKTKAAVDEIALKYPDVKSRHAESDKSFSRKLDTLTIEWVELESALLHYCNKKRKEVEAENAKLRAELAKKTANPSAAKGSIGEQIEGQQIEGH